MAERCYRGVRACEIFCCPVDENLRLCCFLGDILDLGFCQVRDAGVFLSVTLTLMFAGIVRKAYMLMDV